MAWFYLYNTFPIQEGSFILGEVTPEGKRVTSINGFPWVEEYARHLEGHVALGGIPGSGGGSGVAWIALDLDEAEEAPLKAFLEEAWRMGLPLYPSRGLTRGWRIWVFLRRPVPQGVAYREAKRIAALARGLGRVEVFPSREEGGQRVFLPYFGGRNPVFWPDLSGPIPLETLARRVKRLDLEGRERLTKLAKKATAAPAGSRHPTLLGVGLQAFALDLPRQEVWETLVEAAQGNGLWAEDREEVERLLAWCEVHARRQEGTPLPLPDPRSPLLKGRPGVWQVARAFAVLYHLHGYVVEGKPTLCA